MLYIGEEVGTGSGPSVDIALDPLEGTTITAKGLTNALSVIAMAERGNFLYSPDILHGQDRVGGGLPEDLVDLDREPATTSRGWQGKGMRRLGPRGLHSRPARHEALIRKVREAGARIMLISDGDISGVIATSEEASGIDIYLGMGGAPEGVLAAAALRCIGGQMQGRLVFRNDDERARAGSCGITDFDRKYDLYDMAGGDVVFAATGVTDGAMLGGIRRFSAERRPIRWSCARSRERFATSPRFTTSAARPDSTRWTDDRGRRAGSGRP